MSRTFPIVVLVLATLIGGGAGLASTSALGALLTLPDGKAVPVAEGSVNTRKPKKSAGSAMAVAKGATSDRAYLKGILCRNLFDPSLVGECDFDVGGKVAAGEEVTDIKATLLGTLVATPAAYSSALILEDGEERAIGYSLNDKLHDATIVAIEKKLVRLRRGDGREEVLAMGEDAPRSPAKGRSSDDDEDEEVSKVGENHFEIDQETLDKHLSDLDGISRMGRALLHRGPDGEFDGYRLSALRRNTIADKLGIKNGDVVHTVNGKPLTSMAAAMEAYNTMQNEKNFSFEVTRNGKKMQMSYDVK